jgi:hypothetical protein
MMRMLCKWIILAIIILGFNLSLFGQTIGYFSIDQSLDSNPFRYLEAESSWISELGFGIQHNSNDLSLSYTGNYTRFETLLERNFYWHQAAIFANSKNFQYGVVFEQTINGIDYEVLNSNQYSGYINSNFNIADFNFYGNLDGNFSYYPQLEELDNFNLDAGLKMQKSFESGTTFIVGSIFHFKKYLTNIIVEDSISGSMINQGGHGTGGQGINTSFSEYDAPSVSQIQYWFRLAQSITNSTGLALQYQSRLIVGGTSRYFSGVYFNYADESQIFDDPLGYENKNYGAELTQLLPLGIVLKAAFYQNRKEYSTQGIYTDTENYIFDKLRKDTRTTAWVTLQKKISSKFLGSNNVTIKLTYQWLDNESNSYLYNYKSHYTGLGFSLNF